MADIWVNFADGRVATVRLDESARVQDIAQRAGVVLHQRACRIAVVMQGGTDPLAHEVRLCDIVAGESPSDLRPTRFFKKLRIH